MDEIQLRARIMRMREIAAKPHGRSSEAEEAEVMTAVLDLLEDFLLDHKRQTELLEGIMFDLDARTNRELGRS